MWNGFPCLSIPFPLLSCASIFARHLAFKGHVPCVLNVGLPCFPFPRAWKIALAGEFSSWLVIAGNALF